MRAWKLPSALSRWVKRVTQILQARQTGLARKPLVDWRPTLMRMVASRTPPKQVRLSAGCNKLVNLQTHHKPVCMVQDPRVGVAWKLTDQPTHASDLMALSHKHSILCPLAYNYQNVYGVACNTVYDQIQVLCVCQFSRCVQCWQLACSLVSKSYAAVCIASAVVCPYGYEVSKKQKDCLYCQDGDCSALLLSCSRHSYTVCTTAPTYVHDCSHLCS